MEYVQPIRDKRKIESMKRILKGTNLRDYLLFVLGINSGLRISDLLKLRMSDVIDEKGRFKDRIVLREEKTNKTKNFPLSENAVKAIKEYLTSYEGYDLLQPLFPSRKGGKSITRQQAYRVLNQAARTIGLVDNTANIGTHTLRKTFGYHAYKSGVDIAYLQKLFNHSAPSVTLAYIGITQDQLDDIYLNLNL